MEHIVGRLSGGLLLALGVACCAPTGMPVYGRQNYRAGPDPRHEFHPARARLTNLSVDGDTLYPPARPAWLGGQAVTVCIHNSTKWNKGIGRAAARWFQADPGGDACIHGLLPARGQRVDLYKAKFLGVMTKMGTRSLNLTGWAGYQITFDWTGT